MGRRKKQNQQSNQPNEDRKNTSLIVAIIGAFAVIIGAIISCLGSVLSPAVPIVIGVTVTAMERTSIALITHTADIFNTNIAVSTQVYLSQITETPTPSFTPPNTPTGTATAIPSESPSATPTRIQPVRYEYTVQVGDTLKLISKKYLLEDSYADAIGKANCNQSPVAGDVLVIRYFYTQQGDTIGLISQIFGGKPNFLRAINNLSQEVESVPPGKTFILPGKCGGS